MEKTLFGRLGLISYAQAIALEEGLCKLRYEGRLPDTVLVMEHPQTVTMGRFGKQENVLVAPAELARRGVAFARSNRGGDVTFHAPGQLVLHAVMDLRRHDGPLRGFITNLEETALRMLTSYGVAAERLMEHPGLWVNGRQIVAIGLHLGHGVSSHGLAINVNPDLSLFGVINLCGQPGLEATSITRELNRPAGMRQAVNRMMMAFAAVFRAEIVPVTKSYLTKLVIETSMPEGGL